MPSNDRILTRQDFEHQASQSSDGLCRQCLRPHSEAWGRSWVRIDLAALRHNAQRVAAALPAGGRLIVSAKKDAYGHGMLATAEALADLPELGALGVATVEEGLALRNAECGMRNVGIAVSKPHRASSLGLRIAENSSQEPGDRSQNQSEGQRHLVRELPVLCFSVLEGEALEEAIRHGVWITVTDLAEARAADTAAARVGRRARAHFKLDTGMGRTGRLAADVMGDMEAIRALPNLELAAIYSHLADAWADPEGGRAQGEKMSAFRRTAGLEGVLRHWGGSDALAVPGLLGPGDWVRSGIALYGDHPAVAGLEPVMTFTSRVIYRRRVPAGTAISYGGTYRTTRETELAMVGAGYGNGLPRALSGRGAAVLLRGRRCPMLGRVCMDQVVVDVTELGDIPMGEEAVIFGRQGAAVLPAAEQAALAGTISYELFCVAGQLNPHIYS